MIEATNAPFECYICTDEGPDTNGDLPRRSPCLCTLLYVHNTCLKRALDSQSNKMGSSAICTVCKSPLEGVVTIKHVGRMQVSKIRAWLLPILLIVSSVSVLVCAMISFATAIGHDGMARKQLVAFGLVFTGLGACGTVFSVGALRVAAPSIRTARPITWTYEIRS